MHCTIFATLGLSACSGSDTTDPVLPNTPIKDEKAAPPKLPPVEPGTENRATVSDATTDEKAAPPKLPPSEADPGQQVAISPWRGKPCDKIPQRRGQVFRYGDSLSVPELKWTVKTEALIGMDLDGLGSPVSRVPELARLNGLREVTSLSWSLYIERPAGCAHLIGSYGGHSKPWLLATSHRGMRDFSTSRTRPFLTRGAKKRGKGNHIQTTFTFDGQRYKGGRPQRR